MFPVCGGSVSDSDERATFPVLTFMMVAINPNHDSMPFQGEMWIAVFTISCLNRILETSSLLQRSYFQLPSFIFLSRLTMKSKFLTVKRWIDRDLVSRAYIQVELPRFPSHSYDNPQLIESSTVNKNSSWHPNKVGLLATKCSSLLANESLCGPERTVNQLASSILHAMWLSAV